MTAGRSPVPAACGSDAAATASQPAFETRRRSIASVLVCVGCCCGRVDRGRPAVPVDWLKTEFKARKLLHHVHLTITGCLGPCDVPNVVAIVTEAGSTFLGHLDGDEFYLALLDWATMSRAAGVALPLPPLLARQRFARFGARTPPVAPIDASPRPPEPPCLLPTSSPSPS